jgi:hypothetical protein
MDNARSSSPSAPGAKATARKDDDDPPPRARRIGATATTVIKEAPPSSRGPTDDAPMSEPTQPMRDVPVDWEALEDAFENNAPEVHSYLQLATGEVIRVVDGVADPQMHARIAADPGYLRVDPVSSREQYRWMERFIPMVENNDLRGKLTQAIDGKGAFRRFKDVLMAHAEERERWFGYRSERLKTFMDAWLAAHSLHPVERPAWAPGVESTKDVAPESSAGVSSSRDKKKSPDALRRHVRELAESLGPRDLEMFAAFGDFLRARRILRTPRPETELEDAPPSSTRSDEEKT